MCAHARPQYTARNAAAAAARSLTFLVEIEVQLVSVDVKPTLMTVRKFSFRSFTQQRNIFSTRGLDNVELGAKPDNTDI